MSPDFPLRAIFDDGECIAIDSPEQLIQLFSDLDSSDPHVWIRDANDRNVHVSVRGGIVQWLDLAQ